MATVIVCSHHHLLLTHPSIAQVRSVRVRPGPRAAQHDIVLLLRIRVSVHDYLIVSSTGCNHDYLIFMGYTELTRVAGAHDFRSRGVGSWHKRIWLR